MLWTYVRMHMRVLSKQENKLLVGMRRLVGRFRMAECCHAGPLVQLSRYVLRCISGPVKPGSAFPQACSACQPDSSFTSWVPYLLGTGCWRGGFFQGILGWLSFSPGTKSGGLMGNRFLVLRFW